MLKKLIKYDIKAALRLLVPMYASLLAISLISLIFTILPNTIPGVHQIKDLSNGLYILFIIVMLMICVLYPFYRFYVNYYTDEGYLMFTLPVKNSELLISKMISGLAVFFSSYIVVILSFCIAFKNLSFFQFLREFYAICKEAIEKYWGHSDIYAPLLLIACIVIFIGVHVFYELFGYLSISAGQFMFKGHKIAGSIIVAIALYFIIQMINLIIIIVMAVSMGDAMASDMNTFANTNPLNFFGLVAIIYVVLYSVLGTVYYILNKLIMQKKLSI